VIHIYIILIILLLVKEPQRVCILQISCFIFFQHPDLCRFCLHLCIILIILCLILVFLCNFLSIGIYIVQAEIWLVRINLLLDWIYDLYIVILVSSSLVYKIQICKRWEPYLDILAKYNFFRFRFRHNRNNLLYRNCNNYWFNFKFSKIKFLD